MRLGTFTNSSQLIRSYSICVRCPKYHGRQNCFIFLQTLYQNHKATAQSDCNIYIAILFRMSKEKNNLYDTSWARQRLHRLHKSFILCCTSIWKRTETQSLLWYWSYFWHSRFFISLKLHLISAIFWFAIRWLSNGKIYIVDFSNYTYIRVYPSNSCFCNKYSCKHLFITACQFYTWHVRPKT